MNSYRVLVVGAGAVGGFFGARLVEADVDVTFLVRGTRRAQLKSDGLVLEGPGGSQSIVGVSTISANELRDSYDLVLLATKASALEHAIDDFVPAVGTSSVVLPVMNGIAHIEALVARFGHDRVLGGVAVVAAELHSSGTIRQLTESASITLGALDGTLTDQVERAVAAFQPASFDTFLSEDIVQAMWEKWFFMAAGGASNVLLDGASGGILDLQDGRNTVANVVDEVAEVLSAAGRPVRALARDRVWSTLATHGSSFTTSLYRDFVAKRRGEVETIFGDMIAIANREDLAAPLLRAAAVRVRRAEASS